MTRINLLPWRQARRRERQRNFIFMLAGGVLVGVASVVLTLMSIDNQIANQQARNDYLRGEIARLKKAEAEIQELDKTKVRLRSRLEVIQNLQTSRPDMVKVFDAIPRLLPENVFITSIKTEGKELKIEGVASANDIVSAFMRNLADSNEFGEPTLTVIENKDINDTRVSVFKLAVGRQQAAKDMQGDIAHTEAASTTKTSGSKK